MKRFLLPLLSLLTILPATAQKEGFTYKFYGFVRGDLFYNSRANVAPVDGNFYMYPMDIREDSKGEDLNATPNGSFYTFTTRLGIDLTGPSLGKARTSAKIETDFGGFSASTTMLRIRQAYVALDWQKSQLLIGQTWHPLSGAVMPDVLNLSSGAPFNPFNRSPMLRLQQKVENVKLTAATIWQLQYLSAGPAGASEDYIKNRCIPEVYIGADYTHKNWLLGIGGHMISLKPRTVSQMQEGIYKVDERITAFTAEAHLKYSGKNMMFAAKTLLGSLTDHSAMLGGYGIHSANTHTGEQEYTPFRHSTSWVNFTYGTKWKAGIFAGYAKNLGTSKSLVSSTPVYGKGLDIDQLIMINPSFSYNAGPWRMGIEYCLSNAHYGAIDIGSGKVHDTHAVSNHRILGLLVYSF
ncbi:hypothetical protein LJC44_02615 [Parabacteroides sp. OttesenSCG-928-G06]|nr:hypothetical protein [Parabacteroides sp. OttesenSCG-928-G06]